MGELQDKRIVLGVTGGIAAYKACEVARRLGDAGARIDVVMTEAAQRFVTAVTFQALTGRPVHADAWDARIANNMPHIELTRGADALLVVPASADFLAKLAHGLCDDLLSTMAVARPRAGCPLMVVPAMNVEMWDHPATRRNVDQLRADGTIVIGPSRGAQACGESGEGRMLEPHEIVAEVVGAFQPKLMRGRHVLVTAGPTFEPIDPVRGLTNLSSGKMGYAIARAAHEAGATVTLVSGPTALATPYGVERRDVLTAAQMLEQALASAARADVFIGVAAVADWRVAMPSASKLKKDGGTAPALELATNPDILAAVAALPEPPYCVGFAAESDQVLDYARAKRIAKKIPLIVANRVSEALGADAVELTLIDGDGATTLARDGKLAQARRLIAEIARRLR